MRTRALVGTMVAMVALGSGCSDSDGGGEVADQDDASETSDESSTDSEEDEGGSDSSGPGPSVETCDLVSVDDLSEVVGNDVIVDEDGSNEFTCSYTSNGPPAFLFTINVFEDAGSADEAVEIALEVDEAGEEIDLGDGGWVIFEGRQVGFVQDGLTYQVDGSFASLGGDDDPTEVNLSIAELIEANL